MFLLYPDFSSPALWDEDIDFYSLRLYPREVTHVCFVSVEALFLSDDLKDLLNSPKEKENPIE